MDKPTDEELSRAIRHSIKHRAASPVLYEAFDVFYRYRAWADGELGLAARQETHLAQKIVEQRTELRATRLRADGQLVQLKTKDDKIVEQRAQLASLEHLRFNHDQAVRERSFVSNELADANEKIRVLQADVAKGQREFDRRLKAKDARIEEIERDRVRLVSKACDSCGRATNRIGGSRWTPETDRPQWVPETSAAVLEAQIEALSGEKPKDKSYADAELGVIQDCLEALNRIPANQRAAVTQYLTSRAHTAAWGAIPQQQAVPPW